MFCNRLSPAAADSPIALILIAAAVSPAAAPTANAPIPIPIFLMASPTFANDFLIEGIFDFWRIEQRP